MVELCRAHELTHATETQVRRLAECEAKRRIVEMFPVGTPIFEDGRFLGLQPRDCAEHRTVGSHRAWCHQCCEWCYPDSGCVGCANKIPAVLALLAMPYAEHSDYDEAWRP